MIHQVVTRFRSPIRFGDEFTRRRYYEREWLPAYQKQRCEFAVAPGLAVRIDDKTMLPAGSEITADMLEGDDTKPGGARLLELVETGHVIEKRDPEGTAA